MQPSAAEGSGEQSNSADAVNGVWTPSAVANPLRHMEEEEEEASSRKENENFPYPSHYHASFNQFYAPPDDPDTEQAPPPQDTPPAKAGQEGPSSLYPSHYHSAFHQAEEKVDSEPTTAPGEPAITEPATEPDTEPKQAPEPAPETTQDPEPASKPIETTPGTAKSPIPAPGVFPNTGFTPSPSAKLLDGTTPSPYYNQTMWSYPQPGYGYPPGYGQFYPYHGTPDRRYPPATPEQYQYPRHGATPPHMYGWPYQPMPGQPMPGQPMPGQPMPPHMAPQHTGQQQPGVPPPPQQPSAPHPGQPQAPVPPGAHPMPPQYWSYGQNMSGQPMPSTYLGQHQQPGAAPPHMAQHGPVPPHVIHPPGVTPPPHMAQQSGFPPPPPPHMPQQPGAPPSHIAPQPGAPPPPPHMAPQPGAPPPPPHMAPQPGAPPPPPHMASQPGAPPPSQPGAPPTATSQPAPHAPAGDSKPPPTGPPPGQPMAPPPPGLPVSTASGPPAPPPTVASPAPKAIPPHHPTQASPHPYWHGQWHHAQVPTPPPPPQTATKSSPNRAVVLPSSSSQPPKPAVMPSPSTQIELNQREEIQNMGCTCKRTHCLKLYCQCFAAKLLCGTNCRCLDCFNNEKHETMRNDAILHIITRNPLAFENKFRPKNKVSIPSNSLVTKTKTEPNENEEPKDTSEADQDRVSIPSAAFHRIGCKCRKSGCIKKYCECFASNVRCTRLCRCMDCKNTGLPSVPVVVDRPPVGHPPYYAPHMQPPQHPSVMMSHHVPGLPMGRPYQPNHPRRHPPPFPMNPGQPPPNYAAAHQAVPKGAKNDAESFSVAQSLTYLKRSSPLTQPPATFGVSPITKTGRTTKHLQKPAQAPTPETKSDGNDPVMMAAMAMAEFGNTPPPAGVTLRNSFSDSATKQDAVLLSSSSSAKRPMDDDIQRKVRFKGVE